MARLTDETINTLVTAGVVAAGYEIVGEAVRIAREDYKIDEGYIDDFCISIRDLKRIVKEIKVGNNEST